MEKSPTYSGNEDVILLHGDDSLTIQNDISAILGDMDALADLNVSKINARDTSRSEIMMHLNMLPMAAGKRRVILDNADEILQYKKDQEWIEEVLDHFPVSTQLILVIVDQLDYKGWKKYKPSHWLRKMIRSFSGSNAWQERPLPDARHMPNWIIEKVEGLGGKILPAAAQALANMVGNDLFQAEQEIHKAIAYCGSGEEIGVDVIRLLCAASPEEKIFDLMDAVGKRDGKQALNVYQNLALDASPQYIFSMLAWHIRLLMQTRWILDEKGTIQNVLESCDIRSEWQAKKLIGQARQFKQGELESIYRNLDRMDEESKMGRISIDAALEPLLASITRK